METITINIHELNKLLQEKVKTNPFFTYHLSKELLEEVKALNMHIVSGEFKEKKEISFEEYAKNEKIEKIGLVKYIDREGYNISLAELTRKYKRYKSNL